MKVKNKDLVHVINFLDGLSVKGLKSIHRTSISNKLKAKLESFASAQKQLQKEYKEDPEGFQDEYKKLLEQYNTIDDTDSKIEIASLKSVLIPIVAEDSDHEFKDGDAIGVAALYESLKLGGEK
jgi:sortase (surface protein transpeptidase)